MVRGFAAFVLTIALLQGCATAPPETESKVSENDPGLSIRVLSEAEVIAGSRIPPGERLLADLLFEGLQALDADRLLTPADDNAYARFQRVLAYDPNNEIALQGLEDIVLRYVQLSQEASYQGLFDEAELLLDRARFVNAEHPAIENASRAMQEEMDSGDLFFDLDYSAFNDRTEDAKLQLQDIAQQARKHSAFFLITAPNDDLARWMFSVMREAVSGYRLRGNIEMASRVSIRLRMPSD